MPLSALISGEVKNIVGNQTCPLWATDEGNSSDEDYGSRRSIAKNLIFLHPVAAAFIILYAAVALLSICGNMAVLFVVAMKKEMRTVTNLFICNLAFSDLIVTMSSLWMTPLDIYLDQWILGRFMCYLSHTVPGVSILVSTFTLTGIAIDRYVLIMYPGRNRMSSNQCGGTIAGIWIVSVVLIFPILFHVNYYEYPPCLSFCKENWDSTSNVVFAVAVLVIKTIVPFLLIMLCYWRITGKLRDQQKRLQGRRSSEREVLEVSRKKRLNRILMAMVAIFVTCSLPLDAINLLKDIRGYLYPGCDSPPLFGSEFTKPAKLLSHLIAMTATLWNPLLYAWWNENFKRELLLSSCVSHHVTVLFESQPVRISVSRQRITNRRSTTNSIEPRSDSSANCRCLLTNADSNLLLTATTSLANGSSLAVNGSGKNSIRQNSLVTNEEMASLLPQDHIV